MPARLNNALDQTAHTLDTYVKQSPTASPELQHTLGDLGRRFEAIAARVGVGTRDPGNRDTEHGISAPQAALATEKAVDRAARLSGKFTDLAEHAGHAFGIAGATLAAGENISRLAEGTGRTEHAVGLAGNLAEIGGGVAAIAGVTVGAPVAAVGAAIGLGADAVSAYRDRQEYVHDVSSNLTSAGMDPARAEALARSNPDSLRALASHGYTPQQISDIAANAPSTVRMHVSQTDGVIGAGQRLGLSPTQVTDLARRLGPQNADTAFDGLQRVIGGNPGSNRSQILQNLQNSFDASPATRQLAQLLSP
jgi:hypothetical protein